MLASDASSVVDHGLEPWLCQTKDYKIGICCFSAKHAALRRKSKDWLALNQDDMSEWSDMSIIFVYMWIEVSEHYKDPI
jgi:hypothetical protein